MERVVLSLFPAGMFVDQPLDLRTEPMRAKRPRAGRTGMRATSSRARNLECRPSLLLPHTPERDEDRAARPSLRRRDHMFYIIEQASIFITIQERSWLVKRNRSCVVDADRPASPGRERLAGGASSGGERCEPRGVRSRGIRSRRSREGPCGGCAARHRRRGTGNLFAKLQGSRAARMSAGRPRIRSSRSRCRSRSRGRAKPPRICHPRAWRSRRTPRRRTSPSRRARPG